MEIERLNYLTERAQGNDIYDYELEAINLAELVRRTESGKESSNWDVFAQIKIGDSISILKRFYYDDEGGKVSIVINNKGTLSESQYNFKDAFKWHGEGYLEVEEKDSYKAYVSSVGMISKDEQGDLELKGNIGLMYEYKALFEVLHPQSRVIVPEVSGSKIISSPISKVTRENIIESEQVIETTTAKIDSPEAVGEEAVVKDESENSKTEGTTTDLDALIEESQAEVNEHNRRLGVLENGGRLSVDEAYDADKHAAAEARLLGYKTAAEVVAALAAQEARDEEPVVDHIVQAPMVEQPRESKENSEVSELKRQLEKASDRIVLLENELSYVNQENAELRTQVDKADRETLELEIEYAPLADNELEILELQPESETKAKDEMVIFNGAVRRADGKFVSPIDHLTKSERGKEAVVDSEDKESIIAVSLSMYDLDNGMRIGFPRMLRNKADVLMRANNLINLFDPLKHDLGWLEDEIRKMVKSLKPSYTKEMLANVKLIPPEPEEE